MVKIVIENLGKKELLVNERALPVLQQIHGNFVDWMHSCGGKGRCTSCKMIVVSGMENLSSTTPAESRYRAEGALGQNERLACQTRALGDIIVRVPEEYKLPHVQYTE